MQINMYLEIQRHDNKIQNAISLKEFYFRIVMN